MFLSFDKIVHGQNVASTGLVKTAKLLRRLRAAAEDTTKLGVSGAI